ncbi:hypothetical protein GCM10025864_35750 [Luteimicrobium album]|uniref:DUF3000 family protein n=1 Tax=Luteimicrobium album TaxID=1054550 RepID=A0ABQ6I699_9MICO|nr:hypothetical protein GCM10025864_35750 [Luteimicrobium album]
MSPAGEVHVPEEFQRALRSLRDVRVRADVSLHEIPAPTRVAPFALALTGELAGHGAHATDAASGRFVVLYDPDGQEVWQGRFRAVTMVRAPLERDLVRDPSCRRSRGRGCVRPWSRRVRGRARTAVP